MKVKFKKVHPDAVTPTRAHATDAGFDLTACWSKFDDNGAKVYGTGIAMEIPEGYVGLVFPRSSIAKQDIILTNCVGVIDSGYRGEILAKFKPLPVFDYCRKVDTTIMADSYNVGDRIAQLIIMPIPDVEFEETDILSESERGIGGYGSSGV